MLGLMFDIVPDGRLSGNRAGIRLIHSPRGDPLPTQRSPK
jgi:hypothetical protein